MIGILLRRHFCSNDALYSLCGTEVYRICWQFQNAATTYSNIKDSRHHRFILLMPWYTLSQKTACTRLIVLESLTRAFEISQAVPPLLSRKWLEFPLARINKNTLKNLLCFRCPLQRIIWAPLPRLGWRKPRDLCSLLSSTWGKDSYFQQYSTTDKKTNQYTWCMSHK